MILSQVREGDDHLKLNTLTLMLALAGTTVSGATIELVGKYALSGSATDKSGLTGSVTWPGNSMPADRLGGFGSGIAYTGFGNTYVAVNDRGPGDGQANNYPDRFHAIDIAVDITKPVDSSISFNLLETRLLIDTLNRNLVGQSNAFSTTNAADTLRFDPEAVRVTNSGNLIVSDEYGPFIYEFAPTGKMVRRIELPAKFQIALDKQSADPANELPPTNTTGRQPNRGMEGLAITPDGKYAFGIMQNSLIQDNSFDAGSTTRRGLHNRIVRIDLTTGETKEFVYELNRRQNGVNEIVAINQNEFLVIERDGDAGTAAAFKQIYKIDVSAATDVSNKATLPRSGTIAGVTKVSKSLFLDLLDPAFGLAGASFPEKIEGLAFGPTLSDGRLLLLVTSDNDFDIAKTSNIYAFAIEPTALRYTPQQTANPFQIVPEPGTYAMAGIALAALVALRRRG